MTRIDLRPLALTAVAAIALAASLANAQTNSPSAPSGAAASKAGAPTIAVTVSNQRAAGVLELDAALAGSPTFKALVKKLGPGKKAVVTLPRNENCVYDLYVKYDDGQTSTISGLNVCEDAKINLVD